MRPDIEALHREVEALARGAHIGRIEDVAAPALALLTPPERISTTQCAARYRYIPDPIGGGASLWSADLTPYINPIQDAADDAETEVIIVPKPGRVGGTIAAENILFKKMKFGPMIDTGWYLPSDSEVDSYADRTVRPLFELHSDIQAKVGRKRSDDKRTFKRVAGRIVEWLQLNRKTITSRTIGLMVGDEIDAANPKLRSTFVDQALVRGTTVPGSLTYLCSHMDAGWTSGIAAAWKESSRGIWYMPCPHCAAPSSPCPTAPKGWRWTLDYERLAGVSDDEILDHVEASAGLKCPHCGKKAAEVHKPEMLARGFWVHEGQTVAADGTITGEPRSRKVLGFWIHGTMSPWVGWGDIARRYVAALVVFERTKKSERLREVTAKVLGEVYEGAESAGRAVDPIELAERAAAHEVPDEGYVPADFLFVTAAVDVGGSKFDVLWRAWDLEGRSHVIKRRTIRQRMVAVGGKLEPRDIRPAERQDDWLVLEEEVLRPLVPLDADPAFGLPVAGMAIDTGDGHVTWKAREFARQMARKGYFWGKGPKPWQRVRLIKGARSAAAPELPVKPREVNVDEEGRKVSPSVLEYDLGVHKLKELAVERVAESEGGPGQVTFAAGLPRSCFTELGGEVLIDGAWERRGPNETLDLMAYDEAVRQMLRPERQDILWEPVTRRPVWARPVPITGAEPTPAAPAAKKTKTIMQRFNDLNETAEEQ